MDWSVRQVGNYISIGLVQLILTGISHFLIIPQQIGSVYIIVLQLEECFEYTALPFLEMLLQ